MELALVYSFLILAVIAVLQSKRLDFLEPYRSLFTIVAGVIAIITFYVLLPVPEWAKYVLIVAVVIAVIAVLIYSRKHKDGDSRQGDEATEGGGGAGAVFTLDDSHENVFERVRVNDGRELARLKKSWRNKFIDIIVGKSESRDEESSTEEKDTE